jgi:transposase
MLFGLGLSTRIYIGVDAVDMRKGFDGLYGLVRDRLGQDPLSGHLFLFANRSRTRLKALVWDGSGFGCAPNAWRKDASVGLRQRTPSVA